VATLRDAMSLVSSATALVTVPAARCRSSDPRSLMCS